jgi:replicative DNA helicase
VRIAKHRNGSLETIKLRALLHIQKFVEEEGDDLGPKGGGAQPFNGGGGNWKPVGTPPAGGDAGAKLFIQKGSKMNSGEFDEGFDEAAPF